MHDLRTSKYDFAKSHKRIYCILLLILIFGIIIGSFALKFFDGDTVLNSNTLHHNYIICGSVELKDSMLFRMQYPLIILFSLFLCGFSAVLQPFELCLLLWHGFSIGISVSYYYFNFGLRGFLVVLFLVLPFAVLSSAILIFAVYNSFCFSNAIGKMIVSAQPINNFSVKFYSIKFTAMISFLIVISIIQSFAVYALKGIL